MTSTTKPHEEIGRRRIKSIEVGFRILRVLERADGKVSLREISAEVGMPPSNVHLYLASFLHEGIAEQDPATSRYGLGPFAIQLGAAASRQSNLIDVSRDLLSQLREETRDSVFLSVWGNRGPTILFKIDGEAYGPMGIRVGHVLPLLSTATGRVFISHIPETQTKVLIDQERKSSLSLAGGFDDRVRDVTLSDIVESVKKSSFAQTDAKMSGGYPAAAAPVFDQAGQICAVVTILGPDVGATDDDGGSTATKKLVQTAQRLSNRLGAPDRK
ncbi:IclR family transcriptional regulator [Lacisediminimonas profundi]|uniref:IclR family transcriptional regulator n=1 Tax=Lacisediminimonas profundi TaxID=2603856 RepID=UPI0013872728|nr:IclR family transcriptional regulator [Lacisediminimonas profundi]